VAVLAGCRRPGSGRAGPRPHASPDPLQPLLAGALDLVNRYDATIAGQPSLAPRLAPLRAEHWTHVTAFAAALGRPVPSGAASPSPSAGPPGDARAALAALRGAEKAAQASAAAACLTAPAGEAALIGSVAACRATHLELLT
jgi:hypothetical protein